MSEWRQIADIAETNPETLGVGTEPHYLFKYIDLSSVEEGHVRWGGLQEYRFVEAPSRARRKVRPGDVLFGTVRPNLRSHGYVSEQQSGELVASTGFSVIRAREGVSDGKYLFFAVLGENVYAQSVNAAVGSNYPAVNNRDVRQFRVFAPPLRDQQKIAQILDTLDTQIRQTEALIAKLERIKQGLLTDLLTRGIDKDGQLRPTPDQAPHLYKDSPLGRILRQWEVIRLRECTARIADRDHTTPLYVESGVCMVSPTNLFEYEGIDFTGCKKISPRAHQINCKKTDLAPGDIIIHRIGAGLGRVRLVTEDMPEFSILHSMAQIRPDLRSIIPGFLLWALRSDTSLNQMGLGTQSIGVPDLGLDKIGGFRVPLPPLDEQAEIANRLHLAVERLTRESRMLAELHSLKSGLMDDLLTGRVRVSRLIESESNETQQEQPTYARTGI